MSVAVAVTSSVAVMGTERGRAMVLVMVVAVLQTVACFLLVFKRVP